MKEAPSDNNPVGLGRSVILTSNEENLVPDNQRTEDLMMMAAIKTIKKDVAEAIL